MTCGSHICGENIHHSVAALTIIGWILDDTSVPGRLTDHFLQHYNLICFVS